MKVREYHQTARADAASERTERILAAALDLFVERPFDQITLASVAERADVGLQTVIRRVGTKEGLVAAINDWITPQVAAAQGEPTDDPASVAATVARHNERWGALIMRTLQQEDAAPALADNAARGRQAHRSWIDACFASSLAGCPTAARRELRARLVAATGTELWTVLTRDEGLSVDEAQRCVQRLIETTLADAASKGAGR